VAIICELIAFASGAEGLAGARACPNRSVCRPTCKLQGEGPSANTGEEVALGVSVEISRLNVCD
jgi:hypothetical protein